MSEGKNKTPSHLAGRPSSRTVEEEQKKKGKKKSTQTGASQAAIDAVESGQNPDGTRSVGPDGQVTGTWDYSNQRYVDTLWDETPDGINSRLNAPGYFGTANITAGPQRSSRQDVWDGYGYYSLSDDQKKLVRDATYSHYGGREVDPSYFDKILDTALAQSAFSIEGGNPITVEDALRGMLDPDALASGGGGGGGGGGRAAPQAPDATSIRRIMDATSNSLIGRTLSDKEFNKYYKQYVGEFNSNPDIDTQQVLTERVRKEKDYQEASVAGKFSQALASVMKGAL